MKALVQKSLGDFGLRLIRTRPQGPIDHLPDLTEADRRILLTTIPFTMTGVDRLAGLVQSVRHVTTHDLPGAIVECGVWRGGSMMAAALTLLELGQSGRDLYLYDTFAGMPPPTAHDQNNSGASAEQLLRSEPKGTGIWCHATLEDVRANLLSTGYPSHRLHFVQGKVEDTIPHVAPGRIALLRLDTDWYESTRHELTHLYPRLCAHGVLIIDDYGHWQGARKAVDEYATTLDHPLFLHRLDYTGRIAIKPTN